jgi:hypothetical protein
MKDLTNESSTLLFPTKLFYVLVFRMILLFHFETLLLNQSALCPSLIETRSLDCFVLVTATPYRLTTSPTHVSRI